MNDISIGFLQTISIAILFYDLFIRYCGIGGQSLSIVKSRFEPDLYRWRSSKNGEKPWKRKKNKVMKRKTWKLSIRIDISSDDITMQKICYDSSMKNQQCLAAGLLLWKYACFKMNLYKTKGPFCYSHVLVVAGPLPGFLDYGIDDKAGMDLSPFPDTPWRTAKFAWHRARTIKFDLIWIWTSLPFFTFFIVFRMQNDQLTSCSLSDRFAS